MNHSLYQDGILKALPFKRLPWTQGQDAGQDRHIDRAVGTIHSAK